MIKETISMVAQIDQPLQEGQVCVYKDIAKNCLQKTGKVVAVATDGTKVLVETELLKYLFYGDGEAMRKSNFHKALDYNSTVTVHGSLLPYAMGKPARIKISTVGVLRTSTVEHTITAPNGDVTLITRSGSRYIVTGKPL